MQTQQEMDSSHTEELLKSGLRTKKGQKIQHSTSEFIVPTPCIALLRTVASVFLFCFYLLASLATCNMKGWEEVV